MAPLLPPQYLREDVTPLLLRISGNGDGLVRITRIHVGNATHYLTCAGVWAGWQAGVSRPHSMRAASDAHAAPYVRTCHIERPATGCWDKLAANITRAVSRHILS